MNKILIGFPGDLLKKHDYTALLAMSDEERMNIIGSESIAANMAMIRGDLAAIGIHFDLYFSESDCARFSI